MTTDALKKVNRLQRFNPKAWIGYLIGYDSTNVYRVWNPVTNKVVRTRDVTFNEYETFNGDLEKLKDDMLGIKLDELSKLLQECTIPEESEETQVQTAQEELDEIRSLAEDEIQVYTSQMELDETVYTALIEPDETDQKKMPSVEVRFQPYPTPPLSPPAAMLAASIRGTKDEISKKETSISWTAMLATSIHGTKDEISKKETSRISWTES